MDKTDKEVGTGPNGYYIAQMNSMEIKISELRAQLDAKNYEIDCLTNKISNSKSIFQSNFENQELENQLKIVLEENKILKKSFAEVSEIKTVKAQIEQTLRVKELFDKKYKELLSQTTYNEDKSIVNDEEENIQKLKKDLELEKKLREQYQEKLEKANSECLNLRQEISDKNKQILELETNEPQIFKQKTEKKSSTLISIASPTNFIRPQSANRTRKNAHEIHTAKNSSLRKNFWYQSPKLSNTADLRKNPKVVSISLELNLTKNQ